LNLLLVSLDSLRFDFVSRTNPQLCTPRFDALSRAFAFSERCFSVSSATRPVHTTLFTGLYPFEHGVVGQRAPGMRPGIPHLFGLFAEAGYQVGAFSQAAQIFAGLDYAPWVQPLEPCALAAFLRASGPRLLFLHYWETHTPYGAADGKALGDTARLLRQGRRLEVIAQYQQAVERVFEERLAPLLAGLDLGEWMVLICGDHGESWTEDELYHGQTLSNSVLRVPLYLHLPRSGNPPLTGPLVSLVDVFATVEAAFGLRSGYRGYGRALWASERPLPYLGQLDPAAGKAEEGEDLLIGAPRPEERQWCLIDGRRKFTCWEESGRHRLEGTFTGEALPLSEGEVRVHLKAYGQVLAGSAYRHLPGPAPGPDPQLDLRLRELGYL
jgi:membrane-anchored protein YejM (alkaline phosphatase superfamily)